MRPFHPSSSLVASVVVLAGLVCVLAQEPAKAKKYALLVGINKYQHADLNRPEPLQYAEADVTALKAVLEQSGYTVTLLAGQQTTLKDIRAGLAALRKNGSGAAVVLAAFAGHGIQPENSKEAYFCPYDADQAVFTRNGKREADWDVEKTMLPLSEVLVELRACGAEAKAIFVDACRNDPKTGRGRGFGTAFNIGDLPENLALLLSCSRGERAWEDRTWSHGAFFHHVLKALREGKGAVEGHVTANSLSAYVSRAVRDEVPRVIGGGATQRPHTLINGDVDLLIAVRPFKPEVKKEEPKVVAGGDVQTLDLGGGVKLEMVRIPAGKFLRGSPDGEAEDDEKPQREITISPFYLAKYETTVGQFRAFVKATGHTEDSTWQNPGWPQTDSHAVVNVSHNDAVAFCQWLSQKAGQKVALPTEAQWEYACRAGTTTRYHSGDGEDSLKAVANINSSSTMPVGRFKPNAFGLHDMHGNVWEWCADQYSGNYYRQSPEVDPPGPSATGAARVIRGGSFGRDPRYSRAAHRNNGAPSFRDNTFGFRVALVR
ncbi:MAG: SUMF1/EgtB/PvdO family nonheme iron enzyme [Gemmataceae bacterium]|nr:SUMF1/EgtB/PvdO family nonheme iron enzyme [Gemmataceae bacterium]